MRRQTLRLIAIAVMVGSATMIRSSQAQGPFERAQPDITMTAAMRTEVIEGILKTLKTDYVFPEVAQKMDRAIHARMQNKEYDAITGASDFAHTLTTHLQAVSKDKHLRVRYSYEPIPVQSQQAPSALDRERFLSYSRSVNFGFEKMERMDGNIGYLDLRGFFESDAGGDTATAAMGFLANTDALIIDLRKNGGGSPEMIALICSYFFEGEPVHLNDLYFRPEDRTQQFWTLPYVPGKRYVGKDVYVLTSSYTFSGAEEFTYNLKNLKRATIVGETTGGGAHPGGMQRITDHFSVFVPIGRAINPITKTNWEGTGVKPDVAVPADQALKTAYLLALKNQVKKTTDPKRADDLKAWIATTQKELDALKRAK
jgi:C-terminal processing protease CtpA/Prc